MLVPPTHEFALIAMRQPTVLLLREGQAALHRLERHCARGEPLGELYTEGLSFALVSYLDGWLRQVESAAPRTAALSRLACGVGSQAHFNAAFHQGDGGRQGGSGKGVGAEPRPENFVGRH